ncbi:MAG: hypothetical protein CL757_02145 [Chloroflexi bacterium]|nr:hypothetical protein [Chloroflexota bacterium]
MPSFWENIRFPDDHSAEGEDMATYVSYPVGADSVPAIIVVQEAFGVNGHMTKVCDQFAEQGFVAVSPAIFHRQSPNPKIPYGDPSVPTYMGNMQGQEIIDDIDQTIDYLQNTYPRTQGQKIGIVGYCLGGRVTYLAATSCPGLSAASVYYGGGVNETFPDGINPLSLTKNIEIPVMGNFGETDTRPSPEHVAEMEESLKRNGKTYDFKIYPGAGHGFNCDERDSYDADAAKDALDRTLGWFNKYLK